MMNGERIDHVSILVLFQGEFQGLRPLGPLGSEGPPHAPWKRCGLGKHGGKETPPQVSLPEMCYTAARKEVNHMAYELPPLPYGYEALEPHIDAETMRIHHGKHHQAYVDKLNAALEDHQDLAGMPMEALLSTRARVPEEIRTAVQNHGGGHANHSIFWKNMTPRSGKPEGALAEVLQRTFGDVASFQEKFTSAAVSVFGSGWTWLVLGGGKLEIVSRPNQDSPFMDHLVPLLGVDVWEHAYYLRYQNRRADYLKAWWNVVHWQDVRERYEQGTRLGSAP